MTLQGLDSALELLEYFNRQRPVWGVRELAKASGKHPAVVHRILATFAERGLLSQDSASSRYSLGVRMFELGVVVGEQMHLTDLVRPVMKSLVEETGETAFMCWLQDDEVTCLDVAESSNPVKFSTTVGARSPMYGACFAKVILAYQDADFIDAVIAGGLARLAPRTVTDPAQMRSQLEAIKARGWDYSEEESAADTCGLAVPIAPRPGRVQGSLCVAGPLRRGTDTGLQQFLPVLQRAAPRVEQAMRSFVDLL